MVVVEAQDAFVRQVLQTCETVENENEVINFLSELYVLWTECYFDN
jgi:hypothetical protein